MALVLATTPRGRHALTKQHLLLLVSTHVGSLITPIGYCQLIEPYPRSAGFFFMCNYFSHMFNSKVPNGIKVNLVFGYLVGAIFLLNGYMGFVDQDNRTDAWMRTMLFSGLATAFQLNEAERKLKKIGISIDDL